MKKSIFAFIFMHRIYTVPIIKSYFRSICFVHYPLVKSKKPLMEKIRVIELFLELLAEKKTDSVLNR